MKNRLKMSIKKLIGEYLILFIAFGFTFGIATAQQSNPPATPGDSKPVPPANNPVVQPPLELPTFIIEGIEQLNIKAGMKQFPSPPIVLSTTELDSINPLEKQQSLLVAPPGLPKGQTFPNYASGFIQAKAGMYATFDLLGAYGAKYKGYELYGRTGLNTSAGDIKNSEYNKFFINLNSDYIAPEIFWIFGGSRTRSLINYSFADYSNYGTAANTQRTVNNFDISLVSDGNHEGVNFSTGAKFSTFALNQDVNSVEENRISGFLNINTLLDNYGIGGVAELNFGNFRGNAMNIMKLAATGAVYQDKLTLEGEVGYLFAGASDNSSQSAPHLRAVLSYLPNLNVTIRGEFFTGLEKTNFMNHFEKNIYLDNFSGDLFFPKINALIRGSVLYQPHTKIGLSLGGAIKLYDCLPYFNSTDTNTIELLFDQATIVLAKADGFWELTKKDKIKGLVGFNFGNLDYKSKSIPYLPMVETSISYERTWFDAFGSEAGILFNSERYTERDNKNTIDSYFNLFLKVNYRIIDNLKIMAEFQNLTSIDNFIWQGYKERGVFGSIGINWQF